MLSKDNRKKKYSFQYKINGKQKSKSFLTIVEAKIAKAFYIGYKLSSSL